MELKIKVFVQTRYVGSRDKEEIDVYVDKDATDEEIEVAKEAAARDWMFDNIEWGWEDLE